MVLTISPWYGSCWIIQKWEKCIFEWSKEPKKRFLAVFLSLVCWIDLILHIVIVLNVFQHVATLPCHEGSFKNHETHQIVPDQQYSRCWEGSSCHPAILPSRLDRLTCCRCDHLAILPCLHTGWTVWHAEDFDLTLSRPLEVALQSVTLP